MYELHYWLCRVTVENLKDDVVSLTTASLLCLQVPGIFTAE